MFVTSAAYINRKEKSFYISQKGFFTDIQNFNFSPPK